MGNLEQGRRVHECRTFVRAAHEFAPLFDTQRAPLSRCGQRASGRSSRSSSLLASWLAGWLAGWLHVEYPSLSGHRRIA